jgi:hypothetical protein
LRYQDHDEFEDSTEDLRGGQFGRHNNRQQFDDDEFGEFGRNDFGDPLTRVCTYVLISLFLPPYNHVRHIFRSLKCCTISERTRPSISATTPWRAA